MTDLKPEDRAIRSLAGALDPFASRLPAETEEGR